MTANIIDFDDGFSVEVDTAIRREKVISEKVKRKFKDGLEDSKELIFETINSVASAWDKIEGGVTIDGAEIEMGLAFGAEGNVFMAKGTARANLNIKIKISRKSK